MIVDKPVQWREKPEVEVLERWLKEVCTSCQSEDDIEGVQAQYLNANQLEVLLRSWVDAQL
jgi:hypothetical protein